MSKYVETICTRAKVSSHTAGNPEYAKKNNALVALMSEIRSNKSKIIKHIEKDVKVASRDKLNDSFIDRLVLNKTRIQNMIDGIEKIIEMRI